MPEIPYRLNSMISLITDSFKITKLRETPFHDHILGYIHDTTFKISKKFLREVSFMVARSFCYFPKIVLFVIINTSTTFFKLTSNIDGLR